jgi:hypothetical protein
VLSTNCRGAAGFITRREWGESGGLSAITPQQCAGNGLTETSSCWRLTRDGSFSVSSTTSRRNSPRSPPWCASSRCEMSVAVSPRTPMYGTGTTDSVAVHG